MKNLKVIILGVIIILSFGSYLFYSLNKIEKLEYKLKDQLEYKLAIKNSINEPWKLSVQYNLNSIDTKEEITFKGKNDDIIFHNFFGSCKDKPDPSDIEFIITFKDENDNTQSKKMEINSENDLNISKTKPSFKIKKVIDTLCSSVWASDTQAPKSVYTVVME